MRILEILPNLRTGGAEHFVVDLSQALADLGHTIRILSLYGPEMTHLETECQGRGLDVRFLGKRKGPDPSLLRAIGREIRAFQPDAIHTHLYVPRYVLPSAIRRKIPVIHTLHNLAEREVNASGRVLNRIAFKRGWAHPVGVGQEIARSAETLYGLPLVASIINGVPSGNTGQVGLRQTTRDMLGIGQGTFLVAWIGRLVEQKNPCLLVKAMKLVSGDCVAVVIGDGPLRDGLERSVAESGRDIRLLGLRPDVPALLTAADLIVSTSDWEGVPIALLEGMAAGKAVVATRVGGVPEIISESVGGSLVAPGDAMALARAIDGMRSNEERREAMGKANASAIADNLNIRACALSYLEVFSRQVSGA